MDYTLFTDYALPGVLIVIMLGMGLSLEKEDFTNVFIRPKLIFSGLFAQMIILPLIAFILMFFSDLSPIVKVGFILIAACPGGTASNLVAHLLNGNIALCISLTAINSLLILITLPLLVKLGLIVFVGEAHEIHLPIGRTVLKIFYTTILPTIIGMYLRRHKRRLANRLEQPLKYVMVALLFSVFAAIIIYEQGRVGSSITEYRFILPWALALNAISMAAGYFFARRIGFLNMNNYTISIQVGMQNSALAIFVAANLLGSQKMAMVAVVYSSFTFFSTALFGFIMKKYGEKFKTKRLIE